MPKPLVCGTFIAVLTAKIGVATLRLRSRKKRLIVLLSIPFINHCGLMCTPLIIDINISIVKGLMNDIVVQYTCFFFFLGKLGRFSMCDVFYLTRGFFYSNTKLVQDLMLGFKDKVKR